VVCIDYAKRPAPLSLYYTDPLPDCGFGMPVLTADGNLAFVGGSEQTGFHTDNFQPVASSWLIYLKEEDGIMAASDGLSLYLSGGIILIILFSAAFTLYLIRKRRHGYSPEVNIIDSQAKEPAPNNQLMARINRLMDERQLFRNSELKPSDIAIELATNTRYVTDCIKGCQNLTFSQYINDYRINYAKQLLSQHPDMQISEVYRKAGFASERSFFRIFKTVTGMTTREWMMTQQD
jgi:AraC-like DNA-binding protein